MAKKKMKKAKAFTRTRGEAMDVKSAFRGANKQISKLSGVSQG